MPREVSLPLKPRENDLHQLRYAMGAGLLVDSVDMRFDRAWMNAEVLADGLGRMPFRELHDDLALATRQIGQDAVADLRGRHPCMVEDAYAQFLSVDLKKWTDLRRDAYSFFWEFSSSCAICLKSSEIFVISPVMEMELLLLIVGDLWRDFITSSRRMR